MSVSGTVQNDQYWEQFSILPADIDHLVNYLVEGEHPRTIETLAHELVSHRNQQMVDLMQDALSQGRIYRPGESYEVGEQVIFPHLGNILGEVLDIRGGRNPEYEPFSVIRVRLLEEDEEREFVAELEVEHPLNTASYLPAEDVSADEQYAEHGGAVVAALRTTLKSDSKFISVADQWFLRDLLMEVSPGSLNIVEALLDMEGGGPLPTSAFLKELELPDEIPQPLQLFSLEYTMLHDSRFDEVGPTGHALWYLQRMEPEAVLETPDHLRYIPIPYTRGKLDETMADLEQRAADEWSEELMEDGVVSEDKITVILTYPHWRSDTLPLAAQVSQLFPTARITDRIRFTFVDGDTGEEFPGWVVRSGRYVYGLKEWYEEKELIVGSFIDLKRGKEAGMIEVRARELRSPHREWVRTVTAEDGQLNFEVTRVPVTCEFDELAAVAVPEPETIDALAERVRHASLEDLLEQAFSGLAGLSLQRAVHARTLYSVLNLVRRVPPAPMLTVLATSPTYVSLGDNYWAYRGEG